MSQGQEGLGIWDKNIRLNSLKMTTIKKYDIYKLKIETPKPRIIITGGEETLPAYLKKDEFFESIAKGIIPDKDKQKLYCDILLALKDCSLRSQLFVCGQKARRP